MTDKSVFLVDIGNVMVRWNPDSLLRDLNYAGLQWPFEKVKTTFFEHTLAGIKAL